MYYIAKKSFSTIKNKVNNLKSSDMFNIPENILSLTDRKLLTVENHPLSIIKEQIKLSLGSKFQVSI
jgi:hypothetical protein